MSNIIFENVVVIGTGAIGDAFIQTLKDQYQAKNIYSFSRANINADGCWHHTKLDAYLDEHLYAAAQNIDLASIDAVFVATGILHTEHIRPEKSLKELSRDKFIEIYEANTIVPALVAKHFIPRLRKDRPSAFCVLSARVGSISDNQLGGWYAYRASKAALNMVIKNVAIETNRINKQAKILGLHPGTVDSALSAPFKAHVKPEKLFSPIYSARLLLDVVHQKEDLKSGHCYAWDGKEVLP